MMANDQRIKVDMDVSYGPSWKYNEFTVRLESTFLQPMIGLQTIAWPLLVDLGKMPLVKLMAHSMAKAVIFMIEAELEKEYLKVLRKNLPTKREARRYTPEEKPNG